MSSQNAQTHQMSELVCPVCYEYMQPPIMLCAAGHSICELCHELMSECHQCGGALTYRRSSHLEALTHTLTFPCRRCGKNYRLNRLESHECIHDVQPAATCLIGQVYGECTWSGPTGEMVSHCARKHQSNHWTSYVNTTTWMYSVLSSIGIQDIFVIDLPGAVFILVQKFDSYTQSLRWNLSCECENKKEEYLYEIHVFSQECSEMCVQRCKIENETNIMSSFPSGNEIVVPVDKAAAFLNSGNTLQYRVVVLRYRDGMEEDIVSLHKLGCRQKAWSSVLYIYNSIKKFLHL